MKCYSGPQAALEDALRLAEAMTYKFAIASIPYGGGKGVIAVPADFNPSLRPALLRRYGKIVRALRGLFATGPDVGTSSEDMDLIAKVGSPHVFGRTIESGGAGDSGPFTASGVFAGIQAVCEYLYGTSSPKGRRVLVQGAGHVGRPLIERLKAAGFDVAFCDVEQQSIRRIRADFGLQLVSPDTLFETECDIFSPCALGGVLNAETIPRLKCRAVVGGANDQLGNFADAEQLRARNIVYAPDFVVNIGGAMAVIGIEALGWTRAYAEVTVAGTVRNALLRVINLAAAEGITTEAAARGIARDRL